MTQVRNETTRKFIYEYLLALDHPRALTVWLLYSENQHDQLSQLTWDPHCYNNLADARDSLAATKLLSKATFLNTSFSKEEVALKKYEVAEATCARTNVYLRSTSIKSETSAALLSASFKIANILGPFNSEEFIDSCGFGPGASTLIKRSNATHPNKFQFETGITDVAHDFVKSWFCIAYPLWEVSFTSQIGSKIVTVPKDSKGNRVIAIEPGLNLWFQKGIGSMIRKRLLRAGIDLNSQRINANWSRIASKYSYLATVDFSSASDTICWQVIEELLPHDWFCILKTFRSSFSTLNGVTKRISKFSSMGNGFTFELESLIFYVLAVFLL